MSPSPPMPTAAPPEPRVSATTTPSTGTPPRATCSPASTAPLPTVPEIRHIVLQWPRLGPYHLAQLAALGRAAQARGVRLTVIEAARREAIYADIREETTHEGFERLTLFPDATFEELPPKALHSAVRRALDRLRPDAVAVNSYSLPDALATLEWARRNRRVAVGMTDTKADDGPRRRWREAIKGRIVGQFDAMLVSGTASTDYVRGLGFAGPLGTGCDVVDNDVFARGADAARADAEDVAPHFVAVSRFIGVKNLPRLLDGLARYRDRATASGRTPWPLVLVGDGPTRADLVAHAAALGLGDLVRFAGFAQIDALPALYGHAAAFVHPATKDTWGLVVNEAMAAGLPVLVSRAAGCAADLVGEGVTGWTFDPNDTDAIADALARIAELPAADRRAMGEAARRAIAAWTPERFAEAVLDLADAGRATSSRGLDPVAGLVLHVLRLLSRSATTFHAVRD